VIKQASTCEPSEPSGAQIRRRINMEQELVSAVTPGSRSFMRLLVGVYEDKDIGSDGFKCDPVAAVQSSNWQ
jgi:hypothetical protein